MPSIRADWVEFPLAWPFARQVNWSNVHPRPLLCWPKLAPLPRLTCKDNLFRPIQTLTAKTVFFQPSHIRWPIRARFLGWPAVLRFQEIRFCSHLANTCKWPTILQTGQRSVKWSNRKIYRTKCWIKQPLLKSRWPRLLPSLSTSSWIKRNQSSSGLTSTYPPRRRPWSINRWFDRKRTLRWLEIHWIHERSQTARNISQRIKRAMFVAQAVFFRKCTRSNSGSQKALNSTSIMQKVVRCVRPSNQTHYLKPGEPWLLRPASLARLWPLGSA